MYQCIIVHNIFYTFHQYNILRKIKINRILFCNYRLFSLLYKNCYMELIKSIPFHNSFDNIPKGLDISTVEKTDLEVHGCFKPPLTPPIQIIDKKLWEGFYQTLTLTYNF